MFVNCCAEVRNWEFKVETIRNFSQSSSESWMQNFEWEGICFFFELSQCRQDDLFFFSVTLPRWFQGEKGVLDGKILRNLGGNKCNWIEIGTLIHLMKLFLQFLLINKLVLLQSWVSGPACSYIYQFYWALKLMATSGYKRFSWLNCYCWRIHLQSEVSAGQYDSNPSFIT